MAFTPFNPDQEARVRFPRQGEIMGVVTELNGGARMMVQCEDGKTRMCRVPGKIKKRVWVREGDVVLVIPWTVEGDQKADIEYRYTKVQVETLKKKGMYKLSGMI